MGSSRTNPAKYVKDSPRIGYCSPCDKSIFLTRKAARKACKILKGGEATPAPFRCPHNEAWWHAGHLPEAVRRGEIDRYRYRATKQPRT